MGSETYWTADMYPSDEDLFAGTPVLGYFDGSLREQIDEHQSLWPMEKLT